jgi:hypothetical protein
MEDRIDVIPVDYCADALLMLLNQPLAHGEVVHISAGEENSVKFAEIDRAMALPWSRRRSGISTLRSAMRRWSKCVVN